MRTPEAIAKDTLETARIKANRNPLNTLILSFLGSAFVALGAMGAASVLYPSIERRGVEHGKVVLRVAL